MSQNDLTIANQGFASFRSDLNSALQALGSTNSGSSAPSTTFANQLFYDTTNNILKIRNEDNDAFISLFTLDQTNDNIEALTVNGVITADSLDISGNIDVDGTTNLDNTDIDGTLNVQGETTLQTHLNMGDNDQIKLGAGADLSLYHDGSNSYITEGGTGALYALTNSLIVRNSANSESMLTATEDGAVDLYHNDSKKFETTSSGVIVNNKLQGASGESLTIEAQSGGAVIFNTNGSNERLRITSGGRFSTNNESSPDCNDGGITLHGGTANANTSMITLKQTNTAHGITALTQTDTQAMIGGLGDTGGLYIQAFSETSSGIFLVAHVTDGNTSKNSGGQSAVRAQARNKSGTNVTTLANHNLFGVYDSSANAKVLIDHEGDIFHDGSVTAYDSYDDAQLVRAFDQTMASKSIIHSKFDDFVKYNKKDLEEAGLLGTCTPEEEAEGHRGLVSLTGMQRLHNGAIWQQYEKHEKLASAFYKLAKKTIGKEEADKLLTQEEIKLLN